MKARYLLASVDRLPTISEQQESDSEDDPDCTPHAMEEYLDSIRELSQPACYPLHGPLRGHRRWTLRKCPMVTTVCVKPPRIRSPWTPVDPIGPSEVSFSFSEYSSYEPLLQPSQNLLDMVVSRSLFAGLL